MRKCLFCPHPADSREHVLPQWLLRSVEPGQGGRFTVHVAHYIDGKGDSEKRHQIALNFKARIVCEQCNTGWMSNLETKVEPILRGLIGKDPPVLLHTFLEHLRKGAKLLAVWLAKTALTTSFALPGRQRLPDSLATEIAKQSPPEGIWVDIATADVPVFAAALTKTFPTINGGVFRGRQHHRRRVISVLPSDQPSAAPRRDGYRGTSPLRREATVPSVSGDEVPDSTRTRFSRYQPLLSCNCANHG